MQFRCSKSIYLPQETALNCLVCENCIVCVIWMGKLLLLNWNLLVFHFVICVAEDNLG